MAIDAANTEATSTVNGIGLVKLMGRSSGFIAMHAALSNRDVNICLIPEVPFEVDGEHGLLKHIVDRLKLKHHIVIIIAEGCGKYLLKDPENAPRDKSGNVIYPDAGTAIPYQLNKDKI